MVSASFGGDGFPVPTRLWVEFLFVRLSLCHEIFVKRRSVAGLANLNCGFLVNLKILWRYNSYHISHLISDFLCFVHVRNVYLRLTLIPRGCSRFSNGASPSTILLWMLNVNDLLNIRLQGQLVCHVDIIYMISNLYIWITYFEMRTMSTW
jgi:hypothetical protein